MPKRRRLGDLYVTGKTVTIDDGRDDPVTVWMQKLNPVEDETATRASSAARVQHLTYIRDRDSEQWRAAYADVSDYASRQTLVDINIRDELLIRRSRIEAELADGDEWSDSDYLQGLVDAWEGHDANGDLPAQPGLKLRWMDDNDDPEASRVHDELERFDAQVQDKVDAEQAVLHADWENVPLPELLEQATEKILQQRALSAFVAEYEVQQVMFSVREPEDHSKLYFENRDEVLKLQPEIRDTLRRHYQTLIVATSEGKDSEATPDSSLSSALPAPAEMGVSSGPSGVSE
jgi:hypothetical protein